MTFADQAKMADLVAKVAEMEERIAALEMVGQRLDDGATAAYVLRKKPGPKPKGFTDE